MTRNPTTERSRRLGPLRSRALVPLLLALLVPTSAASAVFVVTKSADTNDGTCNADCSLREAVIAANARVGADAILVPSGTYVLTLFGAGEDDAATGDLDVWDDLVLQGSGATVTILDGAGADRLLHIPTSRDIAVDIRGLTLRNGRVRSSGGALENLSGQVVLRHSILTGNEAFSTTLAGSSGGGLSNSFGKVFVTDTLIQQNASVGGLGSEGGGVSNFNGTVTLSRSTVSENTADMGAGVSNFSGILIVSNSTVSGNHGGGLHNFNGTTRLTNVTVAGNETGLVNFESLELANTLVAGHPNGDCDGAPPVSLGRNLDGDETCGLTGPGDLPGTDPRLAPLQDNGGPAPTHALLEDSPALEAGDDARAPPTDQRGVPRPQGAASDIGAYESGPCALGVQAEYADGQLHLAFHLTSTIGAEWKVTAYVRRQPVALWSIPLPPVPGASPSVSFPFPRLGVVGISSALRGEGGDVLCIDVTLVDTGSPF